MSLHAVVMAGGRGTRFWPWSRRALPKQLLPIAGEKAMLAVTVQRLLPILPLERILVATSRDLAEPVLKALPELPRENLILEPAPRDTAPCVGLATLAVTSREPEAVLAVLPADHVIRKEDEFRRILQTAGQVASETDAIVTLGIPPSRPETGYGYIQQGEALDRMNGREVHRVVRFMEKPDLATAQGYLADGRHLWNAGMFVFRGEVMRRAIRTHMPDLAEGLALLEQSWNGPDRREALDRIFPTLPKTSIDYGVMERYQPMLTLVADMGWSDVGSFDEVAALARSDDEGNAGGADLLTRNSRGNLVIGRGRTIALVGCEDLIVVDTPDALLICRKGEGQGVKSIVQALEQEERTELL